MILSDRKSETPTVDRVPRDKLWRKLQEYGIDGHLLMAIKSLYCQSEVCMFDKHRNTAIRESLDIESLLTRYRVASPDRKI